MPLQPCRSSAVDFEEFPTMNDGWVAHRPDNLSVADSSFPNLDYNDSDSWGGDTASVPVVSPSRKKINEKESSWFNDEPAIKGIPRKTFKQKQLWFPKRMDHLGDDDVQSIAESIAHSTVLSLASNTADASKYEGLQTKDVALGFVVEQKRMEVLEYSRRLLKGKTISEVKDGIVNEVKGLIATRSNPSSHRPRRASIGGTSEHSKQSEWEGNHATPRRMSLGYALGALPDQSPSGKSRRSGNMTDLSPMGRPRRAGSMEHSPVCGVRHDDVGPRTSMSYAYPKSLPSPRASPYGAKPRIGKSCSVDGLNRLVLTQGQARSLKRHSSIEDDSECTLRTMHTVDTFERRASSPRTPRRSSVTTGGRRVAANDTASIASGKVHSSRRSNSTLTTVLDDSSLFPESCTEASLKPSKAKVNAGDVSVCSSRVRQGRRQSLTGHPSMSSYSSNQGCLSPPPAPTSGPELILDRAPAAGRIQLTRSNSGSTLKSNNSSSGSSKASSPRGVTRLPPTVPTTQSQQVKSVETAAPRRTPRRLSQHSSMGVRTASPSSRTVGSRGTDGINSMRQQRSARVTSSGNSFPENGCIPTSRARQTRRSSMNL